MERTTTIMRKLLVGLLLTTGLADVRTAYFALSWYYLWDVPFAQGQMLGDLLSIVETSKKHNNSPYVAIRALF